MCPRALKEPPLSNCIPTHGPVAWCPCAARYYWINNDLYIRAVNAEFIYGYEYLGNSGRLVITPLTDR